MGKRTQWAIGSALALGLLALGGLAAGIRWPHFSTPPFTRQLKIASPAFATNALLYVARKNDLFRRNGLQVELVPVATGVEGLEALEQGKADLAITFQAPLLMRALQGSDFRIVGTLQHTSGGTAILYNTQAIRTPQHLVGKRIGCIGGTTSEYFPIQYLLSEGIAPSKVTLVKLQREELAHALRQGKIDGISIWDPDLTELHQELGERSTGIFRFNLYRDYTLLVSTPQLIAEKRVALVALFKALIEAKQLLANDPQQGVDTLQEALAPTKSEIVKQMWGRIRPFVGLDHVLLSELQEQLLMRKSHTVHEQGIRTDPTVLIDASILQQASPESVTVFTEHHEKEGQ